MEIEVVFEGQETLNLVPPSGNYYAPLKVGVEHNEVAPILRYTLDGSLPELDDLPFTEPLSISVSGVHLRVRMWSLRDPSGASSVEGFYTLIPVPWTFIPSGGVVTNGTKVEILTSSPEATLTYHISTAPIGDQLTEAIGGDYDGPITIALPTVRYYNQAPTLNLVASTTLPGGEQAFFGATYEYATADLSIDPPPINAIYYEPVLVSLHSQNNGTIRYTLDGSYPGRGSPFYTGPFLINPGHTLKVLAEKPGTIPTVASIPYHSLCTFPRTEPNGNLVPGCFGEIATHFPATFVAFRFQKNKIVITWNTTPSGTYQLERSTDMQTWIPVGGMIPGVVGKLGVAEELTYEGAGRYYRVKIIPPGTNENPDIIIVGP